MNLAVMVLQTLPIPVPAPPRAGAQKYAPLKGDFSLGLYGMGALDTSFMDLFPVGSPHLQL